MLRKHFLSTVAFTAGASLIASTVLAAFSSPTIDGAGIDTTNYTLLGLQTEADGFGGSTRTAGLYIANDDTNLYIAVPGNLSGNSYHIFLDTKAGGAADVATDVGYGEYDDLAVAGRGIMPAGFLADYYITYKSSTDTGLIDIQAGSGSYKGNNGGPNAGYNFAQDNSNVEAVPANYATVSTGAEIQIPLADLGLEKFDSIKIFLVGGNDNKGGNAATYMSNQVLPAIAGASNFGSDGAGGGGDGLNYDGTAPGPTVVPFTYQLTNSLDNPIASLAFNSKIDMATAGRTNGDIRGVDVNPATGNVIVSEDDANELHVFDSDLTFIKTITGVNTPDGTVDPYKVNISDDGQIFTLGFNGSVERVGDESVAVSLDVAVVNGATSFDGGASPGSARGFNVFGDWAAGTCSILVPTGDSVYIFQNTLATPDVFAQVDKIGPIATYVDAEGVFANDDLSSIWVFDANNGTKKFDGTVGSGYTEDTSVAYTFNFEKDMHIDFNEGVMFKGGGSSGYARVGIQTLLGKAYGPGGEAGPNPGGSVVSGLYEYEETGIGNNLSGGVAYSPAADAVYLSAAGQTAAAGVLIKFDVVRDRQIIDGNGGGKFNDTLGNALSELYASTSYNDAAADQIDFIGNTIETNAAGLETNIIASYTDDITIDGGGNTALFSSLNATGPSGTGQAIGIDVNSGQSIVVQDLTLAPTDSGVVEAYGITVDEANGAAALTNATVTLDGIKFRTTSAGNVLNPFGSAAPAASQGIAWAIGLYSTPAGTDATTVYNILNSEITAYADTSAPSGIEFYSDGPTINVTNTTVSHVADVAGTAGDGLYTSGANGAQITLENTVVQNSAGPGWAHGTSWGTAGTSLTINEGTQFLNNGLGSGSGRGISVQGDVDISINGTALNPVISSGNGSHGFRTGNGAETISNFEHFIAIGNGGYGIELNEFDWTGSPNFDNITLIDNGALFGQANFRTGDTNATAASASFTNSTFHDPAGAGAANVKLGYNGTDNLALSFTDCVFTGELTDTHISNAGTGSDGNSFILTNCALVTDGVVGAGTAFSDLGTNTIYTPTNIVVLDPAYVDEAANDLDTQNTAYATASSTAGGLGGAFAYLGGVTPAAIDLTAADGSTIDFGTVSKGTLFNEVEVTNTGGASATITATLGGTDSGEFTVAPDALIVVGAGSGVFTFNAAATSAGAKSATATLDGASASSPATVTLLATSTSVSEWMLLDE